MKKIILILSIGLLIGEESPFSFNGYFDFANISRLSDYSIIDIPYRMGSIDFFHQSENISLNGNITLEYQLRSNTHFLESNDPQDFKLDLRELYTTYSGDNFEFRMGKQIHSWGSVDENSPVDNASAFDYYYIFFLGRERKMATLSGALDYYFGSLKINAVFSPIHTTNRVPLGDDDFPITLPIYPLESQIFQNPALPFEGGIQGTYSFEIGEISASYYSGYDRTFNLTGVNVYGHGSDLSFPYIDILFGYRKTNVLGFGGIFLTEWFILRGDYGFFSTEDKNLNILRDSPFNPIWNDSLHFSYPLHEKANYYQTTVQVETEIPIVSINFIAQYFEYDTLEYSSDQLPIDQEISIPNLDINPDEMTPSFFFMPGMGVPLAFLTKKAAIIIMDKSFLNEQLKLTTTAMLDLGLYHGISGIAGSLTEYKVEYNITQDLLGLIGLTKVIGNKDHPDGDKYQFNKMEDFHI
jgi:hypothetical protein